MRRLRLFLALGLVVIAGTVWIVSARISTPDPSRYFPLADGARWEYGVEGAAFDGLITTIVAEGDGTYVAEAVVADTGGTWQVASYRRERDGIVLSGLTWEGGGARYIQSSPVYILKSPLKPGLSWSWSTVFTDSQGSQPDMNLEARLTVDGFERVEVPAGTFDGALRVTRADTFSTGQEEHHTTQVLWYAPGTGLVLEEHYHDDVLTGRCYLTRWVPGNR